MKRKALLSLILICFTLTGCGNIKFIEKVEPEVKSEESSEQFGNIIIDESSSLSEDSRDKEEPSKQEEENETEKEQTETEQEEEQEGHFSYDNVKFASREDRPTMWVLKDCPLKQHPFSDAKDSGMLQEGDFVTLKAVAEDESWAMVSHLGAPNMFVKYDCLTFEEVDISPSVSGLNQPSSEQGEPSQPEQQAPEPSDASASSQPSTESPQIPPTQPSTATEPSYSEPSYSESEPEPEPEPVDTYQGIAFPSNASSTSFNMGVEFADVTVTLTARKDNTVISNGPEAPSNSSGYYVMASLSEGTTIKCTGIGRNGFVRVEYNGEIGFIDSRSVTY